MFKRFNNLFKKRLKMMPTTLKIAVVLISSLYLAFQVYMISYTVTDLLAEHDYKTLENTAINISENPELLLSTECKIEVLKDELIVTFENKRCKIIAEYNQNYELINTSCESKSTSLISMIVIIAVVTIGFAFFLGSIAGAISQCAVEREEKLLKRKVVNIKLLKRVKAYKN